jgi:hypothetical protein
MSGGHGDLIISTKNDATTNEQARLAPRAAAMPRGHGDLFI